MTENDKRLTCLLTFDFDAMSVWIGSANMLDRTSLSRGEFGAVVAMPRILDLLSEHGVKATFFVPGHTALAFPSIVRDIAIDHEVGHHGWVHEDPRSLDRAGEIEVLEKGLDALDRAAGVKPVGYRSPGWSLSAHTLDLLSERDFIYDSSDFAGDYYPYYARSGDVVTSDGAYRFGEATETVEIPPSWHLSDLERFEFVAGILPGSTSLQDTEFRWREEFEYGREHCPGGFFMLTLHPQCIGHGGLLRMLERLIEHFKSCSGVVFSTVAEYASRWRAENAPEKWWRDHPIRSGEGALRDTARTSSPETRPDRTSRL